MTISNKKISLLIREVDVSTQAGRNLRENLRRIKLFLDELVEGTAAVGLADRSNSSDTADYADASNYEKHLVTADNQITFTLQSVPVDTSKVRMLVNSCELVNGTHFSVVSQTVTYYPLIAGFDLEVLNELGQADIILFQYVKV